MYNSKVRRPDPSWAHFPESVTDEWAREGINSVIDSTNQWRWYCRSGDNLVVVTNISGRITVYDAVIRKITEVTIAD